MRFSGLPNRRVLVLLPLALFLGLAVLFFVRLGGDASRIPSALIGRDAPPIDLPPVAGLARDGKPVPGLAAIDFKGTVTVLNVWASWCVPCHDEAPLLMQLARMGRLRRSRNLHHQPQRQDRLQAGGPGYAG
jgi:cytochrome c biogenesis protein CcmG, thiol:disulfide interchange protein DsbE